MLKTLHIENIAVIERGDIEFGNGFHVLTGETGAGKSIIIDALGAILGERTPRDLVRSGADKARSGAVFENLNAEVINWLCDNGYWDEDESELIITREISADGKNNCRINGRPANVSLLKELGPQLINIHGQHDSQQLLDSAMHMTFIDRFATTKAYTGVMGRYCTCFQELKRLRYEAERLNMDEAEKERKTDMLRYQIQELEQANLQPGEDEEIAHRRVLLHNSIKLADALERAYILFEGDDNFLGICSALGDADNTLGAVKSDVPEMDELQNRASELKYLAMDVSEGLRELKEKMDFSPEEIERIETRFDLISKLKRKYGSDIVEMLEFLDNARYELESIEFSEQTVIKLNAQIEETLHEAQELANELLDIRKSAAHEFEKRVSAELESLDMGKVTFSVSVKERESLDERGCDDIEFFVSTNLGEPLKPLGKIASGGELARIMLAIKNVLAEHDHVQTLIFDEVDAGVSGRAAQRVAEKLAQLSKNKQVLCVTHLAQISAMADEHYRIEKQERDGRTYTSVTPLDDNGRVEELARITGGTHITETTRENARELLKSAREIKKEF